MKEFKLKVSPRMLELLSKDLYSNIYFVLAELIANSYDADAENVYIFIDEKEIRVEDDGKGMSDEELNDSYLVVGGESRTSEENARTEEKKRLKMGRKGVGKLAALSISDGFKLVTKNKRSEPIGIFIPSKIEHDDENLLVLNNDEYNLKKIHIQGTAVIMNNPKVKLPKLQDTIVNNISKIFPANIIDFKIHVIFKGNEKVVIPNETDVINRLATFTSIGIEKKHLHEHLPKEPFIQKNNIAAIEEQVDLKDSYGILKSVNLRIYGWIGTYKTTKGMKKEINEFSDNYLAIFAHNKMGLRNVLPLVGRNRVYESYIVGSLYIDAFEAPDFPDMAGTNRQGYNENDPRWIAALAHIREIVDRQIRHHEEFAKLERQEKRKLKEKEKEQNEVKLKEKLDKVSESITKNIANKSKTNLNQCEMKEQVGKEIEAMKTVLGFKAKVDADKKKIIISHCLQDKLIADLVYRMLLFNNVPKEDIIYSNGPDPETNLPENDIYGYLRKFFVDSASSEMIYVLFVTSKNVLNLEETDPKASWGVLMEIGATWVTQKDHWIFNVVGFDPKPPLNIENKWVTLNVEKEGNEQLITLMEADVNSFVNKIILTCESCGYIFRTHEENIRYLKGFVHVKQYINS